LFCSLSVLLSSTDCDVLEVTDDLIGGKGGLACLISLTVKFNGAREFVTNLLID